MEKELLDVVIKLLYENTASLCIVKLFERQFRTELCSSCATDYCKGDDSVQRKFGFIKIKKFIFSFNF